MFELTLIAISYLFVAIVIMYVLKKYTEIIKRIEDRNEMLIDAVMAKSLPEKTRKKVVDQWINMRTGDKKKKKEEKAIQETLPSMDKYEIKTEDDEIS